MSGANIQLGAHAEALIAETLDKREDGIINGVLAKLPGLDPQAALVAWIEIAAGRRLRAQLLKRTEIEKARHAP